MRPTGLIPKLIKRDIVCNICTRMYTTEHSEMMDTLNLLHHCSQNNGSVNHDWAMPSKTTFRSTLSSIVIRIVNMRGCDIFW
jgi:hypothetical protein